MSDEVLEIAKRYLKKVKRSGPTNIMAVCPFHQSRKHGGEEHSPSFTMSLTQGLYYCFACHARGTLRKFLVEVGLPRARVDDYQELFTELDKYKPKPPDPLRPEEIVSEPLPEGFLGLFDYCPTDLLKEGFQEETLRSFDVGYDSLHDRITYPLRDENGQLIGISGRSLDGSGSRYKVYDTEYTEWGLPERKTKKGGILWNAHNVMPELYFSKADMLVVVEGFKACMWVHQAGIRNVVALLGSFMSRPQQWLIERTGAEVYVMLDNDEAGLNGRKVVASELAKSLSVRLVEYNAPQPSDLTPDELETALATAPDYYRWKLGDTHNGIWKES